MGLIPIILPHVPIQKLSKESARLKKKASLGSIVLELFKSEQLGFLIILIVIPKKLIKKLYTFSKDSEVVASTVKARRIGWITC